jgi:methionine-rich copper-binding protein CopC
VFRRYSQKHWRLTFEARVLRWGREKIVNNKSGAYVFPSLMKRLLRRASALISLCVVSAIVVNHSIAYAQSCTPSSPQLDAGTTFVPFNSLERVEARGGRSGAGDWEWGVGTNTQQTGKFSSANFDWVSGRVVEWTLTYNGSGGATLNLKSGNSQSSLSYSVAPNGMRTGNALKFFAKSSANDSSYKIDATITSINNMPVTGSLAVVGAPNQNERSLVYYFPGMASGFTAKGTIKLSWAGAAVPQGSRLNFTINAGNITCNGTPTDTTKPTISTLAPANNALLNRSTPTISAQYADTGSGIDTTKVTFSVDGVNVTAQATITATGIIYTPTAALTNGAHSVQLSVTDKANNTETASWSFKVDTLGPTISGQTPANNATLNNAKPVISAQFAEQGGTNGSGIDTTKTVLTVDGVNVTAVSTATATGITYTPANNLSAGNHTAQLTIVDLAGNSTQSSWTFTIDTAGPTISNQAPAVNAILSNGKPTISAQYSDSNGAINPSNVTLTLDGTNVTAQASVTATGISYTPITNLTEGAHTATLKVVDAAGNPSEATWSFTVDTQAPTVSNQAPANGATVPTTPIAAISAQFSDTGSGIDPSKVTLTVDGTNVTAQATISSVGVTYTPSTALGSGTHNVNLSVTDKAGNTAQANWSFTVQAAGNVTISAQAPKDTTLPADAIPSISASFVDTGSTGINPSGIQLLVDGVDVTANAQITATGISYTPSTALAEGNHTITLTVANNAGVANTSSWNFVTRSAPTIDLGIFTAGSIIPQGLPLDVEVKLADIGVGIDPQTLAVTVDGTTIATKSSSSNLPGEFVASIPASLTRGPHVFIALVKDRVSNETRSEVNFSVASNVSDYVNTFSPKGLKLPKDEAITASLLWKNATGIDLSTVRVNYDGNDATAQATITSTGVQLPLSAPLTPGVKSVSVSFSTTSGERLSAFWTFEIVDQLRYALSIVSPATGATITSRTALVIVSSSAFATEVQSIKVNGKDATKSVRDLFEVEIPLTPGSNTITADAAFADGTNRSATSSIVYDAPPVVVFTSPKDFATLGPVNSSANTPGGATNLTGTVERPATIEGTVNKPITSLTINQQAATIASGAGGSSFRFDRFFLREGTNLLTAVATDASGQTGTASITVYVDQTAPLLTVEAPVSGNLASARAIVSSNKVDVRGIVADAVEAGVKAPYPTLSVVNTTTSQTITGKVSDRFFIAEDVPLDIGQNTITVTATDWMGNARTQSFDISRVNVGSNRITLLSGNRQRGATNTELGRPLSITAIDKDGLPIANLPIAFDVIRGTGSINPGISTTQANSHSNATTVTGNNQPKTKPDGINPARRLIVNTDANGKASVWFTLGKQSGEAGNMVRASLATSADVGNAQVPANTLINPTQIAEEVVFTATGERGLPAKLLAEGGAAQYAETNGQPLDALSAVVYDGEVNPVPGAVVAYLIDEGDARFDPAQNGGTQSGSGFGVSADGKAFVTVADNGGRVISRPTMGSTPGTVKVVAYAFAPGSVVDQALITAIQTGAAFAPGTQFAGVGAASYQISVLLQSEGPTQFVGKITDHTGKALQGVRVNISRTNLVSTTDQNGNFEFLDQVPPGKLDLFIDGRNVTGTTQLPGSSQATPTQYPSLHFEVLAIRGQKNILPHPIYLPPLLMSEAKIVGGNQDVSLKIPGFEGFEMIVKANSVTFPDGSRQGPLVVSPVHIDRLPMVPPGGSATFMAPAWTIQPTGTRFDPPIEVRIPNSRNMKPGEVSEIYQWDHDLATFVPMGRATVSEDGALLVTDAGYGVTKAGWGGNPPPPPPPPNCALAGQECGVGGCRIYSSVNGCRCLPNFAVDGKKCAECKQCLGGDCVNSFNLPCDDKKYCTENDKCANGQCKGKDIDDLKDGATTWSTSLGQAFQSVATRIPASNYLGFIRNAFAQADLVFEGQREEIRKCCETKQGQREPEIKVNATGRLEFGIGPVPIPGLSLPPLPGLPGYIGVVVQGALSLGGSARVVSNNCADKERCNQEVEAKAALQGEVFAGVSAGNNDIRPPGPGEGPTGDNPKPPIGNPNSDVIINGGVFGKTGVETSYTETFSQGKLQGQFNGLTVGYRVQFFNGLVSSEKEYQVIQPVYFDPWETDSYVLSRIPGITRCK